MMHSKIHRYLTSFTANPGATPDQMRMFENEVGIQLPSDFLAFIKDANGGQGFIGQTAYLILWPIEKLAGMNRDYQVSEFAPWLVIFGSDGGGEAFAFDTRSDAMPIVSVPFVGMELDAIRNLGSNFELFLCSLFES